MRTCKCIRTCRNSGKAILHSDFNKNSPSLLGDSCHLSFIGNDTFLNTFQSALETFIIQPGKHIKESYSYS